jgi:DNA-nicking Smr family endonuclease
MMAKPRTTAPPAEAPASDEVRAFRDAVRDVKPLRHKASAAVAAKPRPRSRLRKPAEPEAMPLSDLPLHDASDSTHGLPDISAADVLIFRRPGVQTQVIRRLRRGLIPIEDELDLHGLSRTAARDELAQFIANGRAQHQRCVRVIHGKGYRSGARGPVLKTAVDGWLRAHLDVMAFTSARAIDGGTGAVYVLLRA